MHQSLAAFEKGLEQSDDAIPSSMVYAYAAIREGIPFANAAPNLTADIPALLELAAQTKVAAGRQRHEDRADADQDDHRARASRRGCSASSGWYSTNILGNRDGEVLDDPESFKTKEESKKSALDYIFQPHLYPELYKDLSHVVRINYYPPRGDNKEGWDNIDLVGWLGYPMQLKINFLCRDSILAAPIVLDSALFLDLAKRAGMSRHPGVAVVLLQGPMHAPELYPEHDLFIQLMKLKNTLRYLQGRRADHAPRPRVLRLMTPALPCAAGAARRPVHRRAVGAADRQRRQLLLLPLGRRRRRARGLSAPAESAAADHAGDGALVGLLAGLIGAVVWLVAVDSDRRADGAVRAGDARADAATSARDMPSATSSSAARTGPGGSRASVVGCIVGFVFMLFVGAVFATLGGLLGAAIFRKDAAAGARRHARRRRDPSGTPSALGHCGRRATAWRRSDILIGSWPTRTARRDRRSPAGRSHVSAAGRVSRASADVRDESIYARGRARSRSVLGAVRRASSNG